MQLAFCLISLFATFVVQLLAFRVGMRFLDGLSGPAPPCPVNACCEPPSGATAPGMDASSPDLRASDRGRVDEKTEGPGLGLGATNPEAGDAESMLSAKRWKDSSEEEPAGAQILGVAVLEFGILFHSIIIGMTISLASPDTYITLFIVIIFHRTSSFSHGIAS